MRKFKVRDVPEHHRPEVVIAGSMRDTIVGQLLPTTVRDGLDIRVGQGVRKSFCRTESQGLIW